MLNKEPDLKLPIFDNANTDRSQKLSSLAILGEVN